MKLIYRGQTYNRTSTYSNYSVQGIYRGVPYAQVSQNAPHVFINLIYRGVSNVPTMVPQWV